MITHEPTGVRGEASLRPMLRRMVAADYPGVLEATLDEVAQRMERSRPAATKKY